ncbi:MAG: hypothetical protein QXD77_03290 [Candidatus Aenigmatarchaeota archaeon]
MEIKREHFLLVAVAAGLCFACVRRWLEPDYAAIIGVCVAAVLLWHSRSEDITFERAVEICADKLRSDQDANIIMNKGSVQLDGGFLRYIVLPSKDTEPHDYQIGMSVLGGSETLSYRFSVSRKGAITGMWQLPAPFDGANEPRYIVLSGEFKEPERMEKVREAGQTVLRPEVAQ